MRESGPDEQSIEAVYRRFFPLVREKCRRMLADAEEAQDVAQETFIRFWRTRPANLEPVQTTAWLYRTSTRLAVDRIRRRTPREAFQTDGASLRPVPESGDPLEHRQLLSKIAGKTPQRELEVAVLHRLDRLTQKEIGDVTALSDRTVRRLLTRFDERLNHLLAEDP